MAGKNHDLPLSLLLPFVVVLYSSAFAPPALCADSKSDPAENRVGAALGVVNLQINDRLLRGLRWNGIGGELRLFFDHDDGENLHLADIRFPLAYLRNRYGHQGAAWDAQVDYGYARRVCALPGGADLSLGARVRWDWVVPYYIDFDEDHIYWMTTYELGPLFVVRWPVAPKHLLYGEIDLAVLALVSRPPEHRYYKIDKLTQAAYFFEKTHEDIRATSVHEHSAVRLRLFHVFLASERLAIKTGYSLDYAYDSQPRPIRVLVHSISTGVAYAF